MMSKTLDKETKDRINGFRKLKKVSAVLASNLIKKNPGQQVLSIWDEYVSPDDPGVLHDFCKSYISYYRLNAFAYLPVSEIVQELTDDFQYFIDTYNI